MPKTKISEFSATPGNNTDIDGINISEGCPPSGINDAIRELMAQLKDFQAGTAGDSFNGPIGATTPAAGTFTNLSASGTFALTGDQVQISEGGTGQTTANAAFNALAPSQASNAGKYLKTDGTNTSWDALDISTADITGTLPIANGGTGLTALGTGVQTALGIAVGSSGAFVTNGGALGTPSSGTVTNLTGTASININGTVGATTPTTGAFTTLSASGNITVSGGTANGVAYLNGSKVLTTGSALTFDGTYFTVGASATTGDYKAFIQKAGGELLGLNASSGTLTRIAFGNSTASFGSTQIIANGADLAFITNSAEQMRLTSTGLGIGTTNTTNGRLNVQAGTASTGNSGFFTNIDGTNNPYVQIQHSSLGTKLFASSSAGGTASNLTLSTPGGDLVLNASGNLGLGVTPSAWGAAYKAFEFGGGGSSLFSGTSATPQTYLTANAFFNGTNWIYKNTAAAMFYEQSGGSHRWHIAPSGTAGNAISFTQAMTLDASGNFILGNTTNASYGTVREYVESAGSTTAIKTTGGASAIPLGVWNTAASGTINLITFFYSAGLTAGSITCNGTSTSYNTSSDYRLKDNPQPLTGSGAFIDALKPKTWAWKADGSRGVGFIAHEVQEVSPASVTGEKDGEQMQAMEYGSAEFIANIIAELQSLRTRVAQLEAK
jgi:hypothetical protein